MPRPRGSRGTPIEQEYYRIMNVDPRADAAVIRKAYRRQSIFLHPDKGGKAEDFQKLQFAYEVLSDEVKRHCYDAFGANYESVPGIEMFIQQLKSQDIGVKLDLTLTECLQGKDCTVHYVRRINGQEEKVDHPLRVPPGTANQHRFVYRGAGNRSSDKPVPGDLIIVVNEVEQSDFKRRGNVLIHYKTINLADAITGSPIEIHHPNGSSFHVHQDHAFDPECFYKIPGQGCDEKSPMFLQVKVEFPLLTDEQKDQIYDVLGYQALDEQESILIKSVSHAEIQRELHANQEQVHHDAPPGCPMQ